MKSTNTIQSELEGAADLRAAEVKQEPIYDAKGFVTLASVLSAYLNRLTRLEPGFPIQFIAEEGTQKYSQLRMRVGPPRHSSVNPNALLSHALLYNTDSQREDQFIQRLIESFTLTGLHVGIGATAIADAFRELMPNMAVKSCMIFGFEIEYDEYYQQLSRTYPEDYPEEFKRKSIVTLGCPVLRLSITHDADSI